MSDDLTTPMPVGPEPPPSGGPPSSAGSGWKKAFIALAVVAVLVIAGAGVAVFASSSDDDDSVATSERSTTTTKRTTTTTSTTRPSTTSTSAGGGSASGSSAAGGSGGAAASGGGSESAPASTPTKQAAPGPSNPAAIPQTDEPAFTSASAGPAGGCGSNHSGTTFINFEASWTTTNATSVNISFSSGGGASGLPPSGSKTSGWGGSCNNETVTVSFSASGPGGNAVATRSFNLH